MADRTGIIYGRTSTFKTWNMGLLAQYIYERTGKVTRYLSADGGSFQHLKGFIDIGILQPLNIVNDNEPISLIRAIIEDRFWPTEINDKFERTSGKVRRGVEGVGAYVFEGVTSIAELLMTRYRGRATGMNPAFKEEIKSDLVDENGKKLDSEIMGGYAMDAYGLIQAEIQSLLIKSWSLPVDTVWWTGHEAQAEDAMDKTTIRGVALVGKKGTTTIGKKIGTMIHAYQVPIKVKVNGKEEDATETRFYFQSHPDASFPKIQWEAKPRVPGDQIEKLLKRFPGGFMVPTPEKGLNEFFAVEDELLEFNVGKLKEWKEKIDREREKAKGEAK